MNSKYQISIKGNVYVVVNDDGEQFFCFLLADPIAGKMYPMVVDNQCNEVPQTLAAEIMEAVLSSNPT